MIDEREVEREGGVGRLALHLDKARGGGVGGKFITTLPYQCSPSSACVSCVDKDKGIDIGMIGVFLLCSA